MHLDLTNTELAFAIVIGVLSAARTARLVIWDAYPPSVWFRMLWDRNVGPEGWGKLIHCQFCLTPWLLAGITGWFLLADGHWTWWLINGVWGFSYISAMVVSYDQPAD